MVTIERPAVAESPRRTGHRGLIAVVAVIVLAVVGIVVWIMAGGDEDRSPIEVVQDLAAAMREDDIDEVNALLNRADPPTVDKPDQVYGEFLLWSMALDAEPTFSDCTNTAYGFDAKEKVTCTITYGDNYFYSQALGETLTSTFEAFVFDDWVGVIEIGTPVGETPNGVLSIEGEFESWVRRNRFQLHEEMRMQSLDDLHDGWGSAPVIHRIGRDYALGQLRMELPDDFMASR